MRQWWRLWRETRRLRRQLKRSCCPNCEDSFTR